MQRIRQNLKVWHQCAPLEHLQCLCAALRNCALCMPHSRHHDTSVNIIQQHAGTAGTA